MHARLGRRSAPTHTAHTERTASLASAPRLSRRGVYPEGAEVRRNSRAWIGALGGRAQPSLWHMCAWRTLAAQPAQRLAAPVPRGSEGQGGRGAWREDASGARGGGLDGHAPRMAVLDPRCWAPQPQSRREKQAFRVSRFAPRGCLCGDGLGGRAVAPCGAAPAVRRPVPLWPCCGPQRRQPRPATLCPDPAAAVARRSPFACSVARRGIPPSHVPSPLEQVGS